MNMQHDGVVIALRDGLAAEAAAAELTSYVSAALGYEQPVETKPMSSGVVPEALPRVEVGDTVPPSAPHEVANLRRAEEGPFAREVAGRGATGYHLAHDDRAMGDPVLRLFLRNSEIEAGGGVVTNENRMIRMDAKERRLMRGMHAPAVRESGKAARVALALHMRHHFTHAESRN